MANGYKLTSAKRAAPNITMAIITPYVFYKFCQMIVLKFARSPDLGKVVVLLSLGHTFSLPRHLGSKVYHFTTTIALHLRALHSGTWESFY